MYLRLVDQKIEYPITLRQFKQAHPNVSFPSELSAELLASYGVFPVTPSVKPERTTTQDPVELTPQLINGAWTQVWGMADVNPEEAARRQRRATDEAEAAAVKADAFVQNFVAMTPAQVSAYVTNNTTNLAQTRALLEKMALMLLALAKREYR